VAPTSALFRGPDGTVILRLEDFTVTNGSDLHVILTPNSDPKTRGDVMPKGYVDLGKLKGNIGNQNYFVPNDVDVSGYQTVVTYCLLFHVLFSVAQIK